MRETNYPAVIDGLFADSTPGIFNSRRNTALALRPSGKLLRNTSIAITHEQGRALLAYTALENAVMLSALEAVCYRTTPFGEQRYRHIVDAYAISAARRIEQW